MEVDIVGHCVALQNRVYVMTNFRLTLFAITLLGIIAAGTGASLASPWRDVALGIAGSLLAAVVFATVHQSQLERFVVKETGTIISKAVAEGARQIERQVSSILEIELTNISRRLQQHVPLRFWPANDSPHSQFNEMVTHAVEKSSSYGYAGDRAMYLCHRLAELTRKGRLPSNLRIRVLLADPRDLRCLDAASRYRVTRAGGNARSMSQLSDELRLDVFTSIYGLYKLQGFCDIAVTLIADIPLFRIEILDRALFVSVMASLQDGTFPDTAYYDETNDYFRYFTRYFENLCSSSRENTFSLGSLKSELDLGMYLERLGLKAPLADLDRRLREYEQKLHR